MASKEKKYLNIVFAQGSDADIIDRIWAGEGYATMEGIQETVNYLAQWDYGEGTEKPISEEEFRREIGTDSMTYTRGEYVMVRGIFGMTYSLYRRV